MLLNEQELVEAARKAGWGGASALRLMVDTILDAVDKEVAK